MPNAPTFILASASPRRRDLLASIGLIPSEVIPADIDETPHKNEVPRDYALRVATEKAQLIASRHPDAIILAADTVVACGRRILPKGENEAIARDCLKLLSGRRHRVMTGLCVIASNHAPACRVVETTVRFRRLKPADINWYIATGEWEGKAGAYAIQGAAQAFIPFINGSYSNAVGLPLAEVQAMLASLRITRQ
jgi:septum formation protein